MILEQNILRVDTKYTKIALRIKVKESWADRKFSGL